MESEGKTFIPGAGDRLFMTTSAISMHIKQSRPLDVPAFLL
jgi:DNA-binding transcriptional LysR family regulator